MKKIIKLKYLIFTTLIVLFSGCGDKFLDRKDLYDISDETYYKNAAEVAEALTGAYSELPSYGGATNPTVMANLESDDCFGGGGSGDLTFHDLDQCTNQVEDNYGPLWQLYYEGILRVNLIIKRFDQAVYTDVNQQNQDHGEAYFLRAYFYFTLAKFFGNVPLIIDPAPVDLPKATADVEYAQIASDMKKAIELMPAVKLQDISLDRLGHATKWAAEGMMARIFLFYTGYYNKTEMPLAEGGSITKDQVIAWVDDCVANSGHGLIPDFRNIWPYSYDKLKPQYPYSKKNNLNWAGECWGNGFTNNETMFAVKYSTFGGWSLPSVVTYSNQVCLYMGLRYQTNLVPWSGGWGAGPVNPQLWASFETGDIRKQGSIIDVTDTLEEGTAKYVWGENQCQDETGLWNKKFTSLQMKEASGAIEGIFFDSISTTPNNYQLWNLQDEILLRFADVLLMGAELGSSHAQDYLDRVRTRAGLPSVAVSLDNIKNERRHELAFEAVRYFDLLRWHDAESVFAAIKNIPVKESGVDALYNSTYRPVTNGFLPIPETQIRLSNNVLVQNPGW